MFPIQPSMNPNEKLDSQFSSPQTHSQHKIGIFPKCPEDIQLFFYFTKKWFALVKLLSLNAVNQQINTLLIVHKLVQI